MSSRLPVVFLVATAACAQPPDTRAWGEWPFELTARFSPAAGEDFPATFNLYLDAITGCPTVAPSVVATLDGVRLEMLERDRGGSDPEGIACAIPRFQSTEVPMPSAGGGAGTIEITDGKTTVRATFANLYRERKLLMAPTTPKVGDTVTLTWEPATDKTQLSFMPPGTEIQSEVSIFSDSPDLSTNYIIGGPYQFTGSSLSFTLPSPGNRVGDAYLSLAGGLIEEATTCDGAELCRLESGPETARFELELQ